jgi:hypothetical protein
MGSGGVIGRWKDCGDVENVCGDVEGRCMAQEDSEGVMALQASMVSVVVQNVVL